MSLRSTERGHATSGMLAGMDQPTCGHTETSNAGRTYVCANPPHPEQHWRHYMVLAS